MIEHLRSQPTEPFKDYKTGQIYHMLLANHFSMCQLCFLQWYTSYIFNYSFTATEWVKLKQAAGVNWKNKAPLHPVVQTKAIISNSHQGKLK